MMPLAHIAYVHTCTHPNTHTQWLDLLHLFSSLVDTTTLHSQHDGLESLQLATEKFQEVTQSIHDDPRLLSLLGKRRGQKGFREMQGEQLRQCLNGVLSTLVCVCVRESSNVPYIHGNSQDDACVIVHLSSLLSPSPLFPSTPSLLCYKGDSFAVSTMSVGGGMLPMWSVELPY